MSKDKSNDEKLLEELRDEFLEEDEENVITTEVEVDGKMQKIKIKVVTGEDVDKDELLCQDRTDEILKMISRARTRLLARVPFFGHLCLKLRPRVARVMDNVHTAGVSPDGTLVLNYDFCKSLTNEQFVGLLCHEVMHPALQFWERKSSRTLLKWNIAHDHAINLIIKGFNSPEIELPPNGLLDDKYREWAGENIYDDLDDSQVPKQISFAYGSGDPKDGSNGLQGDCREDLSGTQDGKQAAKGDGGAQRRLDTEWKISLVEAAQKQEKRHGRGSLPAGLQRLIEELIDPKVDWREQLARFLGEHGKRTDYSYRRPSRRSGAVGEYMPSFVSNGTDVLVLLDTSGSMGQARLIEGASEVQGICEDLGVSVRLMICDAQLYHDVEVEDGLESLEFIVGGGGSDFRPAFAAMEEDGFEGVVVAITDGAIACPQTKPPLIREVVWLIHEHEGQPAPYGEKIVFKD